jgi:Na+-transporting methylmalonyl-CoA/oxaloacetate decarboxylase gamma subunit
MTVVFFVLFVLELLTRAIYFIDPTRKKTAPAAVTPVVAVEAVVESSADNLAVVAVITAAIAAMGGAGGYVSVIRRLDGTEWTQMGRMDAVNSRTQMY